jgi:hypothetical protein
MRILTVIVKGIVNILLLLFYSLFFIIACNFAYWYILKEILNKNVPGSEDPIHIKLAILVIFLTIVITLLFRKFFYLRLCDNCECNCCKKENKENKEDLWD